MRGAWGVRQKAALEGSREPSQLLSSVGQSWWTFQKDKLGGRCRVDGSRRVRHRGARVGSGCHRGSWVPFSFLPGARGAGCP